MPDPENYVFLQGVRSQTEPTRATAAALPGSLARLRR